MKRCHCNCLIHYLIGLLLFVAWWPVTGLAADFFLKWNANSESDLLGYYVYYREGASMAGNPGNADQMVETPLDTTGFDPAHPSHTFFNLKDDTLYYFAVSAYNAAGESELSAEKSLSKSGSGDHQAPVVTAPDNITLSAPGDTGLPATDPAIAAFLSGASAEDDVDGGITAITHNAPAQFAMGPTTVIFSATDSAGNTGTAQATVTVNSQQDTMAPVLSNGRPAGTFEAGTTQVVMQVTTDESAVCRWSQTPDTAYGGMADQLTATTDGTGHSATIDGLTDGASYSRHVRCVDANGNTNADDYTIAWDVASGTTQDQAPVVTAPADMEVTAVDDTGLPASHAAIVSFLSGASATDDVDGDINVITHNAPVHFPMGATIVTFSATDNAGYTGTAQATVTVLSPNDPAGGDTPGSDSNSGGDSSGGCFIGSMVMK